MRKTTPPTRFGQEPDSRAASRRAARSARPTLRMATPSTKPLSTNQNAADRKPENTTSAGAACSTIAVAKNSSATRYSGSQAEAQSATVTAESTPGSSKPSAANEPPMLSSSPPQKVNSCSEYRGRKCVIARPTLRIARRRPCLASTSVSVRKLSADFTSFFGSRSCHHKIRPSGKQFLGAPKNGASPSERFPDRHSQISTYSATLPKLAASPVAPHERT